MPNQDSIPCHEIWRTCPNAGLVWRRWPGEDEYVVFHGAAGETLSLSFLAGSLLELIAAGDGRETRLLEWLGSHVDGATLPDLKTLLASLSGLGFIELDHAAG